jgi:hypothetical protein
MNARPQFVIRPLSIQSMVRHLSGTVGTRSRFAQNCREMAVSDTDIADEREWMGIEPTERRITTFHRF